jgi:PTH1 family peptidyl-tRNA hydrolase
MRHNVGFWCVERLAKESSIALSRRRRHTVSGEGTIEDVPVVLAEPRTFVNNSGRAITSLLALYGASPADLLVVYDDMDLPQGEMRLRPSGSNGGHNGMKSIIEAIGTQRFARLRIGIGRPPMGVDEVDYVLGTMAPQDRKKTDEVVGRAVQAVICTLAEGIDVAMNRFN